MHQHLHFNIKLHLERYSSANLQSLFVTCVIVCKMPSDTSRFRRRRGAAKRKSKKTINNEPVTYISFVDFGIAEPEDDDSSLPSWSIDYPLRGAPQGGDFIKTGDAKKPAIECLKAVNEHVDNNRRIEKQG